MARHRRGRARTQLREPAGQAARRGWQLNNLDRLPTVGVRLRGAGALVNFSAVPRAGAHRGRDLARRGCVHAEVC